MTRTDPSTLITLQVRPEQAGMRLDALLSTERDELSRARAASHIGQQRVTIAGLSPAKIKPGLRVQEGWSVQVALLAPPPSELTPWHEAELAVVYEDDELVVLNKPAGLVVHPGAGHFDHTLVHALLAHVPEVAEVGAVERPGLVHRIDKDTSGLLVVSKTPSAHTALAADFARHAIERRYVAVALGRIMAERLTVQSGHGRHPRDRRKFTGRVDTDKKARTHFTVLARSALASLVVAELETGRTHQIRMHLAERGHPIAGDDLYGGVRAFAKTPRTVPEMAALQRQTRQALHAYALGFRHPRTGVWLRFVSELPADMAALVTSLFGDAALALPPLERELPREASPTS